MKAKREILLACLTSIKNPTCSQTSFENKKKPTPPPFPYNQNQDPPSPKVNPPSLSVQSESRPPLSKNQPPLPLRTIRIKTPPLQKSTPPPSPYNQNQDPPSPKINPPSLSVQSESRPPLSISSNASSRKSARSFASRRAHGSSEGKTVVTHTLRATTGGGGEGVMKSGLKFLPSYLVFAIFSGGGGIGDSSLTWNLAGMAVGGRVARRGASDWTTRCMSTIRDGRCLSTRAGMRRSRVDEWRNKRGGGSDRLLSRPPLRVRWALRAF
jgi:hypothetical protein